MTMVSEDVDMTDTDATAEVPKTATDARVDALEQQLKDMQAKYDADIAEYQRANKELYELTHSPAPAPTAIADGDAPTAGFDVDRAKQAFLQTIGLRE